MSTGSGAGLPARPGPLGRLRAASRPRRGQLSVAVLLALVGFAGVVQARSADSGALSGLRQTELVRILDDSEAKSAQLRDEQQSLQQEYDRLTSGTANARAAGAQAERRAEELGILAGTLAATGPGITITLPDPDHRLRATLVLDAVQELRDAGAEAIQLGSVRIVASTAFEAAAGGVRVGDVVVRPPYVFTVIGPTADLQSALGIPGGVLDSFDAAGLTPRVTAGSSVVVDAVRPG